MVRASVATRTSSYLTPPFSQALTSLGSVAREASEIEGSAAQDVLKPPPVPELPTVTLTPELSPWNASATASVRGATVLEPSMRIVPERSPLPLASSSLSPHAATPRARTDTEATIVSHLELVNSVSFSFVRLRGPAQGQPRRHTLSGL